MHRFANKYTFYTLTALRTTTSPVCRFLNLSSYRRHYRNISFLLKLLSGSIGSSSSLALIRFMSTYQKRPQFHLFVFIPYCATKKTSLSPVQRWGSPRKDPSFLLFKFCFEYKMLFEYTTYICNRGLTPVTLL